VRARMATGEVPQELAALSGDWDIQKVIAWSYLDHDDVYQVRTQSGGGYGDPLDREPSRVIDDVRSGVVSVEGARDMYGVVVDMSKDAVDAPATDRARAAIRARRRERGRLVDASVKSQKTAPAAAGTPVNEFMRIIRDGGASVIQCACGQILSDASRSFKQGTLMEEGLVKEAGPYVNQFDVAQRFVFRQFYCPGCLRRLETEVCLRGEPILHDAEVSAR
jgi:N-methylhydantoinase B